MKRLRPLIDFNDILDEDFPPVSWRELSIHAKIGDL